MVTNNEMLRSRQGLHDLLFSGRFADPYWVTMTAFWGQWQLWGGNPLGYHIVNVLTHALGCVLLWRLLRRLGVPGSWLAATIFAVHPVCVASVAWVSELKNTCSIIFYLLTFLCYLRFETKAQPQWYCLALFLYACALLSKGSVVMLPVILLAMAWWQRKRITAKDLLRAAPFFVLSLASGLVTIWFQNHRAIGGEEVQNLSCPARLAGAAWAVWFYLAKGWLPLKLCVIYPQWDIRAGSILAWIPAVLLCGALLAALKYREGWGRHALFGLGCFVVTLFPVMGLFNMYLLVYCRVVDHWQYLALPASVALAVGAIACVFQRLSVKTAAFELAGRCLAGLVLACLCVMTWARAGVYTSEEKLWSDTIAKNPNAWMAYSNLGNALDAQKKTDQAIRCYERALELKPDFSDAHSNLGNALVGKGHLDKAIDHLKLAVQLQPAMPVFHFNYGVALAEKGRLNEAVEEYSKTIKLKPGYADAHNNLAHVLLKQNKFQEALAEASVAAQLKPDSAEAHYNMGSALSGLGKNSEAIAQFQEALRLRPEFAVAHYDLGLALAMSGRVEEALPHFRELVRLKPDQAVSHSSLATALASLKQLDEAICEFDIALRLQPKDAQTQGNLATALAQRGRFEDAYSHYEEAVRLKPDDADLRFSFGWALAQRGRNAEAQAQFQELFRLRPNDPRIQNQIRALPGATIGAKK